MRGCSSSTAQPLAPLLALRDTAGTFVTGRCLALMPYREGAAPPPDPPRTSYASAWFVLAVFAATAVPLVAGCARRLLVESWRESGAIAPYLCGTAAALVVALTASAAVGGRTAREGRWIASLAPGFVAVVAWVGTLLPAHPARSRSFEVGPEFLRLVRNSALLSLASVLVALVAVANTAVCATRVWRAIPTEARERAFHRTAKRAFVTVLLGVLCAGMACSRLSSHFDGLPATALWFATSTFALVISMGSWLRLLEGESLRTERATVVLATSSAITATLAGGRRDQFGAEMDHVYHCFSSPSVVQLFREHVGHLSVGRDRLSISAVLCMLLAFVLLATLVRAGRLPRPTRRESIRAFTFLSLALCSPALSLHALHAPGASFARARLDRAADFDERDLRISDLDRDHSHGAPTQVLGIGRRFVWTNGERIASRAEFFDNAARLRSRELVERLAERDWNDPSLRHRALAIAIDDSQPVSVIADVLDLASDGAPNRCGLVHALGARHFAWLPSWLDDVRRPHEAIWIGYGSDMTRATAVTQVIVRRETVTLDAPGVSPVVIATDADPRDRLWKYFRTSERPTDGVIVTVDADVRVSLLMRVLDVVAVGGEPSLRIVR